MGTAQEPSDRERAVATYYDRLAPVYGEGELFRARRDAVLAAIGDELEMADAILDLGCGNGAFLGALAARGACARAIGLDLSPAMLRAAQRRMGDGTALVQGDAAALPWRAGSFALVFMSHVLLLVTDIDRCVAEVARALTPRGVLVATVGAGRWRDTVTRVLGLENTAELDGLFGGGRRTAATMDDGSRASAACASAGLLAEWRRAPFSVTWPAVEEWVRIRWLSIADAAVRERAEQWLDGLRPRAAGLTMQFEETLLVARKQEAANDGAQCGSERE